MNAHDGPSVSRIAPYFRDPDCNCDPFDCGPFGHSADCPADAPTRTLALEWRKAAPLLARLSDSMSDQDHRYGRFRADVQGVRLAAAALEDEVREVRDAWRSERKRDNHDGWTEVEAETLQVVAIGIRLLHAIEFERSLHLPLSGCRSGAGESSGMIE